MQLAVLEGMAVGHRQGAHPAQGPQGVGQGGEVLLKAARGQAVLPRQCVVGQPMLHTDTGDMLVGPVPALAVQGAFQAEVEGHTPEDGLLQTRTQIDIEFRRQGVGLFAAVELRPHHLDAAGLSP